MTRRWYSKCIIHTTFCNLLVRKRELNVLVFGRILPFLVCAAMIARSIGFFFFDADRFWFAQR